MKSGYRTEMNETEFDPHSRDALIAQVKQLSPWLNDNQVSEFKGGKIAAEAKLAAIDPIHYGKTRNYLEGAVSQLSPYIRHGIVSLAEVQQVARDKTSDPGQLWRFSQQLAWREFFHRLYHQKPDWIWHNVHDYNTGLSHDDYADELPEDILNAQTDCACINQFIERLKSQGWIHNHARLYLAAYIVHFRRIKWQAGAKWFLHHLIDGDPASNNLSWQWVASTFSKKPYIFNLENIQKFAGSEIDCSPENNKLLEASYNEIRARLFPNSENNDDE